MLALWEYFWARSSWNAPLYGVLDILQDISFVLVEPIIDTATTSAVSSVGVATVNVPTTVGMYVGAIFIIDRGTSSQEAVTVSSFVEGVSFTSTFTTTHLSGAKLSGATFPTGQTADPLFTLSEMLAYVSEAENTFLLRVQPVYATITQILTNNQRFYAQPASAIRMERVSLGGRVLYNESQSNLDLMTPAWESQPSPSGPTSWFQDQIGNSNFGVSPTVTAGGNLNIVHSQKDLGPLSVTSQLLVPDVFAHFVKYGALARIFQKDGEQRDDMRAKYCQKRFDLGVQLALHFLQGVDAEMKMQAIQQSKFSPMPVGA